MKNTFKAVSIALMAVFVFSTATCSGQSGGGRTLNSAEDLKKYLDSQPANSPDKPISVSMSANSPMLPKIAEAINSTGKYVSLNLSGNALTTIPNFAFVDMKAENGCETLVSVTIPNSVTSIGDGAFYGCSSLTSITIPNSVTSIGEDVFYGCTSLTSITLGSGITSFDWEDFFGDDAYLKNLTAINVDSGNTKYSSDQGVLFSKDKTELFTFPQGKKGAYTIPNSVTSISVTNSGLGAFFNCNDLTSLTIPNSVASIGETAIALCDNLTSVTFQGTISSSNIHRDAFYRIGDLHAKYLAGGIGTYTRTSGSNTWMKQ